MARLPPLATFIVTGFFGAGKTTLLNRLLQDPALADTLVVVNEFGAVGLDHLLMEKASEGVVLLASGCLCCALRGELLDTLADLAARRASGDLPAFTRVIIETSGLADPGPVMQTILSPALAGAGYRLHGVVTLVDAVHGPATLDAEAVSVAQVAVADRLLLSKDDLAPETAALRGRLAALNPLAPVFSAANAAAQTVFAPREDLMTLPTEAPAPAGTTRRLMLGHGARQAQGFACHDAGIGAFALTCAAAMTPGALETFFDLLTARHGEGLLRIKGLVKVADDPARPVVVQGVRHVLHPVARLPAWPDGRATTRLVFIGRDLDAAGIEDLFAAFCDEPRLDAPDRAALTDNPLAW